TQSNNEKGSDSGQETDENELGSESDHQENGEELEDDEEEIKDEGIMSSITAQQAKLDLELVPKDKRLEIGKCNRRLNLRNIQREPTFQVILDALALTSCYSAFLITTDVPKGQDFDALPTDEEIVSFLKELSHSGEINSLNDVIVNQMYQLWRTFAALINRILSGKTTGLDKLRLSRA
nr:hypothetical protein [Tanacetum cinerariifolium]